MQPRLWRTESTRIEGAVMGFCFVMECVPHSAPENPLLAGIRCVRR
jgi:hypothetical protein